MPAPDASRIFDALCAYWQSAALTAALDLDLFTVLGGRERSASQLAQACAADAAGIEGLCDSLVSLGFLRVRGRRYRASADAARFLNSRSPDSLVAIRQFFNGPTVTSAFTNLAQTIRRGPSREKAALHPGLWTAFAAATANLKRLAAVDIADQLQRRRVTLGRILDVGAGASPLGIELLRRRQTASLVALDRAPVLKLARGSAVDAGVADRMTSLPGDAAVVDWGGPFDLVLMVNVLDYFDPPGRASLVRKAREALAPNGVLAVCAPLLNESRSSPPDAVAYGLMLVALQSKGRPSTFRQVRSLLSRAGFKTVTRWSGQPVVLARAAP